MTTLTEKAKRLHEIASELREIAYDNFTDRDNILASAFYADKAALNIKKNVDSTFSQILKELK